MCPIEKLDRPKKAMDMELFKKIVEDCSESGVRFIKLHNYGEPLLTPGFDQMLRYIRSRGPNIDIIFASNGSLLNEKWARILIQEKVSQIHITIDGFQKETYEKIRVGLKYEEVVNNVKNFMKLKRQLGVKYPEIYVEMIDMDENKNEVAAFLQHWKQAVDYVVVKRYSTRAGQLAGNEFEVQRGPCFRLWKQMVITNTGGVATCCADWNCNSVLGDINTQTLSDIWQGDVVKRLRLMHLQGRADEIPLCENCNPASWDSMPVWWFQ
jgi:MoaA/NifB/PqqE/SkfB family radical SAM enzyme